MLSNDHLQLIPRTTFDGPILEFDFPGLEIGVAEYDEGPTGCTVLHFPSSAKTIVDTRGGYKITSGDFDIEMTHYHCHAICLAGGSNYGLEAASGVTAGLLAKWGYTLDQIAWVHGAILYDLGVRDNVIYPDKALGRAALESAKSGSFPLGARGAGRSASVGSIFDDERSESSGQGAAFRQMGEVKVAVFTAVNSTGIIVNRDGQVVRGNIDHTTGQHPALSSELDKYLSARLDKPPQSRNTTLTVLVTNKKLDSWRLRQLGRQVHSSMAQAIRPFHTVDDADVFYAVTTDEVESDISTAVLGMVASELAWDAVLAAVSN